MQLTLNNFLLKSAIYTKAWAIYLFLEYEPHYVLFELLSQHDIFTGL